MKITVIGPGAIGLVLAGSLDSKIKFLFWPNQKHMKHLNKKGYGLKKEIKKERLMLKLALKLMILKL